MKYLILCLLLLLCGCGVYFRHNGGDWTFIGIKSQELGVRCSDLASYGGWKWNPKRLIKDKPSR